MSTSRSFEKLYIAGAVASILAFLSTTWIVGTPPWQIAEPSPPPHVTNAADATVAAQATIAVGPAFELSGNVSTDVQRALILKGELEGTPGNSRTQSIREAIKQAEIRRGLPADGLPDRSLLTKLQTELQARKTPEPKPANSRDESGKTALFSGWTIDDLMKVSQIISVLSGVFLGWLGFFRSRPEQPA